MGINEYNILLHQAARVGDLKEYRRLLDLGTILKYLPTGIGFLIDIEVVNFEGSTDKFEFRLTNDLAKIQLNKKLGCNKEFEILNVVTNEITCKSNGIKFKFLVGYELSLSLSSDDHLDRVKCIIKGKCNINLNKLNLHSLTIEATNKITCYDRNVIKNLDLTANILSNNGTLEAEKSNLDLEVLNNQGNIYVLSASNFIFKELNNCNGQLHLGDLLRLTVDDLDNANGNISGLNGTYVKVHKNFKSNASSKIGFSDHNRGSVTELSFSNNNLLEVSALGMVTGSNVNIYHPIVVLSQGIILSTDGLIKLNSPNKFIKMLGVDFITKKLRIIAADFHLSDQSNCVKTILELSSNLITEQNVSSKESIFNLTHEYRTTGKFKVIEYGLSSKNIYRKMLGLFGEISDYNLKKLPVPAYAVEFKASVLAEQGLKFLIPHGKLTVDLMDFLQKPGKNYQGLISLRGNLKVYANTVDFVKTGLVFNQGLIWSPRGTKLGRLVEDPRYSNIINFPINAVHGWIFKRRNLALYGVYDYYSFNGNFKPDHLVFLNKAKELRQLNYCSWFGSWKIAAGLVGKEYQQLEVPRGINNGSFISVKEKIQLIGKFDLRGIVEAKELLVNSPGMASNWEGSVINVEQNCKLTGEFTLHPLLYSFEVKKTAIASR